MPGKSDGWRSRDAGGWDRRWPQQHPPKSRTDPCRALAQVNTCAHLPQAQESAARHRSDRARAPGSGLAYLHRAGARWVAGVDEQMAGKRCARAAAVHVGDDNLALWCRGRLRDQLANNLARRTREHVYAGVPGRIHARERPQIKKPGAGNVRLAVARANIDAGLIEGAIYPRRVDDDDVRFAGDQFLDRDGWPRTHCRAERVAAGFRQFVRRTSFRRQLCSQSSGAR